MAKEKVSAFIILSSSGVSSEEEMGMKNKLTF